MDRTWACLISADLNPSLSLQTTTGKGRSPSHVHKSLPRPLFPDPICNHTHSRVNVTGACPSVAAMKVFLKSNSVCHLLLLQGLCLYKPPPQLTSLSRLHMLGHSFHSCPFACYSFSFLFLLLPKPQSPILQLTWVFLREERRERRDAAVPCGGICW